MKLGSQTGSVVNHLLARGVIGQPEPKVGMGATVLLWSDRHAATVFRVFEWKGLPAVEVRDDKSKCIRGSGHDGSAEYEYSINVNGRRQFFVFKDNVWREAYQPDWQKGLRLATKGNGHGLRLGSREEYRDPSF